MPQFNFKSKKFSEGELASFTIELNASEDKKFTVSKDARVAAEEQIRKEASTLVVNGKLKFQAAIEYVMRENPMLARISRAEIAPDRVADVTVL